MSPRMIMTLILAGSVVLGSSAHAAQGDKQLPENAKKAQELIEMYLKKLGDADKPGFRRITFLDDPLLKQQFPDRLFFTVLYRQYPIGIDPPAPLKVGNVLVVDKDATKVVALSDAKALEAFCKERMPEVKTEANAVDAAKAYLRLAQEIHQDGFYQFDFGKAFAIGMAVKGVPPAWVTGQVNVKPVGGNKGQIHAELKFEAGKLVGVTEKAKLVEGIRPICQATKLLDADPLIRKMAERDILVMGQMAYDYLMQQRAKASPDLRTAIDRIWAQIVEEDR